MSLSAAPTRNSFPSAARAMRSVDPPSRARSPPPASRSRSTVSTSCCVPPFLRRDPPDTPCCGRRRPGLCPRIIPEDNRGSNGGQKTGPAVRSARRSRRGYRSPVRSHLRSADMADRERCPNCGLEWPADAPRGLCPACLLQQALGIDDSSEPADEADASAPSGREIGSSASRRAGMRQGDSREGEPPGEPGCGRGSAATSPFRRHSEASEVSGGRASRRARMRSGTLA